MKFLLGLTGSIGMGKSTTAQMFRDAGCPVWDADAVVHRLYGKDGAAVAPIRAEYPEAIVDGTVSRAVLKSLIAKDLAVLSTVEGIVHPLVAADRQAFIAANDGLLVFDIPLLFETKADAWLDAIAVVSTSEDEQARRVLQRDGMTQAQFETILSRQLPDAEKRAKATYIIDTTTMEGARDAVQSLVQKIKGQMADA